MVSCALLYRAASFAASVWACWISLSLDGSGRGGGWRGGSGGVPGGAEDAMLIVPPLGRDLAALRQECPVFCERRCCSASCELRVCVQRR